MAVAAGGRPGIWNFPLLSLRENDLDWWFALLLASLVAALLAQLSSGIRESCSIGLDLFALMVFKSKLGAFWCALEWWIGAGWMNNGG